MEHLNVGFEVVTAVITKMAVLWVVRPCSPVEVTNVSERLATSIIRAMFIELHTGKQLFKHTAH